MKYGDFELVVNEYAYDNSLYIGLVKDNEPYTDLTVCLGENSYIYGLNQAYVDTNNFPEAEEFIKKHKLGKHTGLFGFSGFCKYPLYEFDLEKIRG